MTNEGQRYFIAVLGDGETWDHIVHTDIMCVTEEGYNRLHAGLAPIDLANDEVIWESPAWSINFSRISLDAGSEI